MIEKLSAKKSLGQNWLKSKTALFKMLEAGEVTGEDTILEVGPGQGALTEKLLEKAKKVIAVEKDDRLISFLQEKFAGEIKMGRLELVHEDILNTTAPNPSLTKEGKGGYKIIANIPYYITGQFLRKFLETNNQPERIVVMVQKEIADRIVARDGKESLLSVSVKAYGEPKKIMKVPKEDFSPAPKVDSAILLISNISKKLFTDNQITEEKFFQILHAGFAHKRKMLIGNLKEWFATQPSTWHVDGLREIFTQLKLSEKIRAEDLKVGDWVGLVKKM
jgi:16S rRNA (adenine1518-N6/adenine1519-N6)-dimethyltransferase